MLIFCSVILSLALEYFTIFFPGANEKNTEAVINLKETESKAEIKSNIII